MNASDYESLHCLLFQNILEWERSLKENRSMENHVTVALLEEKIGRFESIRHKLRHKANSETGTCL